MPQRQIIIPRGTEITDQELVTGIIEHIEKTGSYPFPDQIIQSPTLNAKLSHNQVKWAQLQKPIQRGRISGLSDEEQGGLYSFIRSRVGLDQIPQEVLLLKQQQSKSPSIFNKAAIEQAIDPYIKKYCVKPQNNNVIENGPLANGQRTFQAINSALHKGRVRTTKHRSMYSYILNRKDWMEIIDQGPTGP